MIDQTPCFCLLDIEPATCQQQLHCDVIRNAFGDFDRCCIGHGAGSDFGQGKAGMVSRQNDIRGKCPFEPTAAANPIYRCNHRFVEIAQLLQATKAANAVITIYCITTRSRF